MAEPLVGVFPSDHQGSGFYRMLEPARVLAASGLPVLVDLTLYAEYEDTPVKVPVRDGSGRLIGWKHETKTDVVGMQRPPIDVAVFQRPALRERVQMIPMLQKLGVAVVVELDDDFVHIDPRNVAWKVLHPRLGKDPERTFRNVNKAAALADLRVVSTPALAEVYGQHGPTVTIPNYVPESYLALGRDKLEGPSVAAGALGWAGSVASHPGDLEATRGGVAGALRLHPDWRFHVVGTGEGVRRRLMLEREPTTTEGWVVLEEYSARLAELDLGIVPLELNRFNDAKSYLKGLQMAAVGVPFVASPTGPYVELARLGAGRLARRSKDWRRELSALMGSIEAREDLAERSYRIACTQTYEHHAGRWWDAWVLAAELHAKAAA